MHLNQCPLIFPDFWSDSPVCSLQRYLGDGPLDETPISIPFPVSIILMLVYYLQPAAVPGRRTPGWDSHLYSLPSLPAAGPEAPRFSQCRLLNPNWPVVDGSISCTIISCTHYLTNTQSCLCTKTVRWSCLEDTDLHVSLCCGKLYTSAENNTNLSGRNQLGCCTSHLCGYLSSYFSKAVNKVLILVQLVCSWQFKEESFSSS